MVLSLLKNSVKGFINYLTRAYVKYEQRGLLMPLKAKGSPFNALPVFITEMYYSSLDKYIMTRVLLLYAKCVFL